MTDNARIRWDKHRRAFIDPNERVLASYDPYEFTVGRLEEFQDITAGEISEVMRQAVADSDTTVDPMSTISIDYFPASVGVFRSAWAANYPYPKDMLIMACREGRFEFNIDVVLPRNSTLTDQTIRSLTKAPLAARGMTCIETKFYADSSDGASCELTVLPSNDITVRDMAFMVSQMRDIVMNEPFSASPAKMFFAIESSETQFLLGTVESEALDAKDSHYPKQDRSRIDIASDVAAFANSAKGGLIVIGARTVKDLHGRDFLAEVNGCPIDIGARDRYMRAIEALVYPEIMGIKMCRTPAALGEIFAILIPEQLPDRIPFIVRGAVKTEGRMSSALFQVPVRQGDCNVPARIEDIHRRLNSLDEDD
ncbi:helix-turn-helix domain-containing protein [Nocardia sp. NPDC056000]|uniref:AlbA family DNA-binding domain-containing protein n=1 Tax=Nocardia sp. NPDC056000 TaxID=3345674 RepID=UPI0035DD4873